MQGTVAVVTGANRGLGLETCRQLAHNGYRVVLTSRRGEDGRIAAQKLSDGNVAYYRLDVMQSDDIRALFEYLRE